jgi:predicted CoA-substrate-specific enzyme activase
MERYIGIDAGSRCVKTAVIEESRVIKTEIVSSVKFDRKHIKKLAELSLGYSGVGLTGYGRSMLLDKFNPDSCNKITEITAAVKGAEFKEIKVSGIIDIGGQDTKIIKVEDGYKISNFKLNDKCAAGTGRFIELILNSLDMEFEDLNDLDIDKLNEPSINSTCAVFAETEVILYGGYSKEELISAVFKSIAKKVILSNASLIKGPVIFIGGAAGFMPLKRWIEKILGQKVYVPRYHWFNNAIGAALSVMEKNKKKEKIKI